MRLQVEHMSWDKDLQIIQADVQLAIKDCILVDEPLCIDVGLPALLLSALENVEPNRWAPYEEWQRMPFFVCGCGDPECRGFSFAVKHVNDKVIELIEVEERQGFSNKILDSHEVDKEQFRSQVRELGQRYVQFVEGLEYKPYLPYTVDIVKDLLQKLALSDKVDHFGAK